MKIKDFLAPWPNADGAELASHQLFVTVRCGDASWHGVSFDFDDPRIPGPIAKAVLAMAQPGWSLYFHDTAQGGEWWLFDPAGELVEAFWLD